MLIWLRLTELWLEDGSQKKLTILNIQAKAHFFIFHGHLHERSFYVNKLENPDYSSVYLEISRVARRKIFVEKCEKISYLNIYSFTDKIFNVYILQCIMSFQFYIFMWVVLHFTHFIWWVLHFTEIKFYSFYSVHFDVLQFYNLVFGPFWFYRITLAPPQKKMPDTWHMHRWTTHPANTD